MFGLFQSSRNRAEPVFLYDIVHGSGAGQRLYLTDAEQPISHEGNTYLVTAIEHSEVKASGSLDNTKLELRCPFENPLTQVFLVHPPDMTTTLRIRQGDMNDPDQEFITIWSGRILSFSADNIESKFDCEPIGTATRRPGLRRNFQFGCPHVLYGPRCRANRLARTVSAQPQHIGGSVVSFGTGWHGPFEPLKFIGGLAEWDTPEGGVITRTILQVGVTGQLVLNGVPSDLTTFTQVRLSTGCNHQQNDCQDLHENIANYGGQPWIPLKNPIGNYNSFY